MSHVIACTLDKVAELENSINVIKELKTAKLEQELDNADQYSRSNCLLLHGVKETKKENATDTFIEAIDKSWV